MKEVLKKFFDSIWGDLLITIAVALLIMQFVCPTIVKEDSMQPNIYENDYLILAKKAYMFSEPERGDVIVFKSDVEDAKHHKKLLIKRIVGLPGETIEIVNAQTYIDGELFVEDYIKDQTDWQGVDRITLSEDEYFVMGDNRRVSLDSRGLGPVNEDRIKGKVVFRCFPFNKIGTLHLD